MVIDKRRKILLFVLTAVIAAGVFALARPQPVFAQEEALSALERFGEVAELGKLDIRLVAAKLVRAFLGILGIIVVILIIYGGFLYMTAAGDPEKIAKAKSILTGTVIGLAIILASYSITHFIVRNLREAIMGPPSEEIPLAPPGWPSGIPVGTFYIKGISPEGYTENRKVKVRIVFSDPVDSATVPPSAPGNITIERKDKDTGELFETLTGNYELNSRGDVLTFTPDTPCPEPNEGYSCFLSTDETSEDDEFAVKVLDAVKRKRDSRKLYCAGLSRPCEVSFETGAVIDLEDPTIQITAPEEGQAVSADGFIPVYFRATDNIGISYVELSVDGVATGTAVPRGTPRDYVDSIYWDTAGLELGSEHILRTQAFDTNTGQAVSAPITVQILAAHCFDSAQNFDETGIDCGGADCLSCAGESCTTDSDCASGACFGGVCVLMPRIDYISPTDANSVPNGAVGNFMTIGGRYFGESPGVVTFLGDLTNPADDRLALLANEACVGAWADEQIIVEVPPGAVDGPVKVLALSGYWDRTDNTRGPLIPDFVLNDTVRPGICQLDPREGESGTPFIVRGTQFGTEGTLNFGLGEARATAWTPVEIGALVPTISPGINSVSVTSAGETSNALQFKVLPTIVEVAPEISYLDPGVGPSEEYVTILGRNFGKLTGTVEFLNPVDGRRALALTDFPPSCSADFWRDDSITIKVPQKYDDGFDIVLGAHNVKVIRADGEESNTKEFTINDETPAPGLCLIQPDNGPAGMGRVNLFGERFGAISGQVRFWKTETEAAVALPPPDPLFIWGDKEVNYAKVPEDALTGPVKIWNAETGKQSNRVNFTVQNCLATEGICSADEVCCSDGACWSADPGCPVPPEGAYVWSFSTGFVPKFPRVVEECNQSSTPSPSVWSKRPGGNEACINAIVNVRFDTNVDNSSVVINTGQGSTVTFARCTETDPKKDPCGEKVTAPINIADSVVYAATTTAEGFQIIPAADLIPNTWYEVVLTTGIRGEGEAGVNMLEDKKACGAGNAYCFRFKTRNSLDYCEIGRAEVTPANYTAKNKGIVQDALGSDVLWRANAISYDDACVMLNSSVYPWEWSSEVPAKATVFTTSSPHIAKVEAREETGTSTIKIIAEVPAEGVSDWSDLLIDFTDPKVVAQWPVCDSACVNASVGAKFNTEMNSATLNSSNVRLYEWRCGNGALEVGEDCDDANAVSGDGCSNQCLREGASSATGSDAYTSTCGNRVREIGEDCDGEPFPAFPAGCDSVTCLNSGSVVGVSTCGDSVVGPGEDCDDGNIASGDGCSNDCLNEGTNALTPVFVAPTYSPADPNPTVTLTPPSNLLPNTRYRAVLKDDIKSVSGVGLTGLNYDADYDGAPDAYSWTFKVKNDPNLCAIDRVSVEPVSAILRQVGAIQNYSASAYGAPDQCNPSGQRLNPFSYNWGWSSTDINVADITNQNIYPSCGNGVIEWGEDCDDGNTDSGDGCSELCLNEGTSAPVCGNGTISPGEDCDDGNRAPGDGCSSNCLHEGGGPLCGNGKLDLIREDCDDGNDSPGDGCSEFCLNEGTVIDPNIDPYQAAAAVGQGATTSTEIHAQTTGKDGFGVLEVLLPPRITNINPSDGIVGPEASTYVTIFGNNFGDVPGRVLFSTSTPQEGIDANLSLCGLWTNNRIVVVVPFDIENPWTIDDWQNVGDRLNVTVQTAAGSDTLPSAFEVNTTIRPGICQINPNHGKAGDTVTVSGDNFGDTKVSESDVWFDEVGINGVTTTVANWSNQSISLRVPDGFGVRPVQVTIHPPGQTLTPSNPADFTMNPFITSISPDNGPEETWVTIRGGNFGEIQDGSFVTISGSEAPIAFCANSWSDTQIIAVVPSGAPPGKGALFVTRDIGAAQIESNRKTFVVNTNPLGANLCGVSPTSGPIGALVAASGDNFGAQDDWGVPPPTPWAVGAPYGKSAVEFSGVKAATSTWADALTNVYVPSTKSGDVIIKRTFITEQKCAGFSIGGWCPGGVYNPVTLEVPSNPARFDVTCLTESPLTCRFGTLANRDCSLPQPSVFPADESEAVGVLATDGKYIYGKSWGDHDRDAAGNVDNTITRFGSGYGGTEAGKCYNSAGQKVLDCNEALVAWVGGGSLTMTYYPDGYIYHPTGSANSLQKINVSTGDLEIIDVPEGLLNRNNGLVENGSQLITSDGKYIYNLAYDVADGDSTTNQCQDGKCSGFKVRIFEPTDTTGDGKNDELRLVREFTSGTFSFYTDGIIADGKYIYAIEWSSLKRIVKIDTETGRQILYWRSEQKEKNNPEGRNTDIISGQYDWVNNKVWLGDLVDWNRCAQPDAQKDCGPAYVYRYPACVAAPPVVQECLIETDGLVAHWKFDEGGRQVAGDSAGNNDGILGSTDSVDANDPEWTLGRFGRALSFDGIDDYVEVADDDSLNITRDLTIETWVKPGGLNNFPADIVRDDLDNASFALYFDSCPSSGPDGPHYKLVYNHKNTADPPAWADSFATDCIFEAGIWYYVAVTRDHTTRQLKLFVDGVEEASGTYTGDVISNTAPLRIGHYDGYFKGLIDHLAIYNRARRAGEITDAYNCRLRPVIDSISPPDGITRPEASTYVTISGRNFGEGPGKVMFSKDTTSVGADLSRCPYWTDTRIVAVVPTHSDFSVGSDLSVTVENTSGASSTRADAFEVNTIIRPGICQISPDHGKAGDTVTISGDNFGDTQAQGAVEFDENAVGIASWSNQNINAIVSPGSGEREVKVMTKPLGASTFSNPAYFRMSPYITSITPGEGPEETWVTIRGGNFGAYNSNISKVTASGTTERFDSLELPCGDGWSDTEIIAAVPSGAAVEKYLVKVTNEHELTTEDADSKTFTVNTNLRGAGICAIAPNFGIPGTVHSLYGDNFGSQQIWPETNVVGAPYGTSTIKFSPKVNAEIIVPSSDWTDVQIDSVTVPIGTKSGDVTLDRKFNIARECAGFHIGGWCPGGVYRAVTFEAPSNPVRFEVPSACPISTGLVSHWKFDERSGQTVGDSSPALNHGQLGSAPDADGNDPAWTAEGKIGSALSFDGTNDYVRVSDDDSLNITGDLTIEAWIKPNEITSFPADIVRDDYDDASFALYLPDPIDCPPGSYKLAYNHNNTDGNWAASLATDCILEDDNWYYVAVTRDHTTRQLKLFVDGVEEASGTYTGDVISNNVPLRFGYYHSYFKGLIDNIVIYNRALSPSEVAVNYGCAVGVLAPGAAGPQIISTEPPSPPPPVTDFCPNGIISATFDQMMDSASLTDNLVLERDNRNCHCETQIYNPNTDACETLVRAGWFNKALAWVKQLFSRETRAQGPNWCETSGSVDSYVENAEAARWTFDEGAGDIVTDSSPQGNNGVIRFSSGADVVDRPSLDGAVGITFLDLEHPILSDGVIDKWKIYAGAKERLKLKIFRYTGSGNEYELVGESQLVIPTLGENTFTLPIPIAVQSGDFIGWYWPETNIEGVIKYGSGTGSVRWTDYPGPDISGTATFPNSGNRVYSIQVFGRSSDNWITDGPPRDTVLSFDGVDDYVTIADSPSLRLGTVQTIAAWINVNANSTDWARLVGKGDIVNRNYGLWRESDGDILFQIYGIPSNCNFRDNAGPGSDSNIAANSGWHHVVATYNGTTGKIYIDGNEVHSSDCNITPHTSADPLTIGYAGYHTYFNGSIDDVIIYNRALSADEIQELYQTGSVDTRRTVVTLAPGGVLDYPNQTYRATIKGGTDGVKNLDGIAMINDYSWDFTTRSTICAIDRVDVFIEPPGEVSTADMFTCAGRDDCPGDRNSYNDGNQHAYLARAYDPANNLLSSIYYTWTKSDPGNIISLFQRNPPVGNQIYVTPAPLNGKAVLTVTADGGIAGTKSTDIEITNFLCENPWPSLTTFPYEDSVDAPKQPTGGGTPISNFSTYYCRDAEPLLPDISKAVLPGTPELLPSGDKMLKEFLFVNPKNQDAIGMRIYSNDNHLSTRDWYNAQGFAGSPQAITVDGYTGLRDGRTVYVNVANVKRTCYGGDPNVECDEDADCAPGTTCDPNKSFTNIYLISYNQGASAKTQEIFEQMLANWKFNINLGGSECVSSIYTGEPITVLGETISCELDTDCAGVGGVCNSDKALLIRDLKRLEDLSKLTTLLKIYKSRTGKYPTLEAGTFLRSMSTSRWPSWQATLGNELGMALPEDPLNELTFCGAGVCGWSSAQIGGDYPMLCSAVEDCYLGPCAGAEGSKTCQNATTISCQTNADCSTNCDKGKGVCSNDRNVVCADNTDCVSPYDCLNTYDPGTCWDSDAAQYRCPEGSHIYQYQNLGADDYILKAELEYRNVWDWGNLCSGLNYDVCRTSNWCEWNGTTCVSGFSAGRFAFSGTCQAGILYSAAAGVCGDRIINPGEVCEIGQTRIIGCLGGYRTDTCNLTCSDWVQGTCELSRCGDGIVVSGVENCDDGINNGRYGYCKSDCSGLGPSCGDGTTNGPEVCDSGALNGTYDNCNSDCTATLQCGDGIVTSPDERCEEDGEPFAGICGAGAASPCLSGQECVLPYETGCNRNADCPTGKNCIYNAYVPPEDYPKYRHLVCGAPEGTASCRWLAWSVDTATAMCGDGIKQGLEECDDGNDDNTDDCVIRQGCKDDPIQCDLSVDCKIATCGDEFVHPEQTEQADAEACDMGAVATCGANTPCTDPEQPICVDGVCARSADYGRLYNYCTNSCTIGTLSGGYCGDVEVQPEEQCDTGYTNVVFKDDFDTKDTTAWTYHNTLQVVPTTMPPGSPSSGGTLSVVKSQGTDNDYNGNFYRNEYSLSAKSSVNEANLVSVDFFLRGAATDSKAHFAVESSDGGYHRFGIIIKGNKIIAQIKTPGINWITSDLSVGGELIFDVNRMDRWDKWYTLNIRIDDNGSFYLKVYQKNNPSIFGEYVYNMPSGKNWRFHHWIWQNYLYIDNYKETHLGVGEVCRLPNPPKDYPVYGYYYAYTTTSSDRSPVEAEKCWYCSGARCGDTYLESPYCGDAILQDGNRTYPDDPYNSWPYGHERCDDGVHNVNVPTADSPNCYYDCSGWCGDRIIHDKVTGVGFQSGGTNCREPGGTCDPGKPHEPKYHSSNWGEQCDGDTTIAGATISGIKDTCNDATCQWTCTATQNRVSSALFANEFTISRGQTTSTKPIACRDLSETDGYSGTGVTVGADVELTDYSETLSVVFVIDRSDSMDECAIGTDTRACVTRLMLIKAAIAGTNGALDKLLEKMPKLKIGLVSFSSDVSIDSDLVSLDSSNINNLKNTINGYSARGNTHTKDALGRAFAVVNQAPNPNRIIILLSDGDPDPADQDPSTIATSIKSPLWNPPLGVKLYTIAFTDDAGLQQDMCEWSSTEDCTSVPTNTYDYAGTDNISDMYNAIINSISLNFNVLFNKVSISAAIIPGKKYIEFCRGAYASNKCNLTCDGTPKSYSLFLPADGAKEVRFTNFRATYCSF